jgi:hypothetical protein
VSAAAVVADSVSIIAAMNATDYYDNYFKGFLKCIARGEGMIGHRNYDQRIYGAISYVCYKAPGAGVGGVSRAS